MQCVSMQRTRQAGPGAAGPLYDGIVCIYMSKSLYYILICLLLSNINSSGSLCELLLRHRHGAAAIQEPFPETH
jgi:hypothetical protein